MRTKYLFMNEKELKDYNNMHFIIHNKDILFI